MAKKVEKKKERAEKLRLRIKAYDNKLADSSCRRIIEVIKRFDAEVIGPIPLPTENHKYTVNRSTFVHKNSREQFELKIHKRLIDILNPSQNIVESLSKLTLPAGIDIEIKMI